MNNFRKRIMSSALALALVIASASLPGGREVSVTKTYAAGVVTAAGLGAPTASYSSGTYNIFNGMSVSLSSDPGAMIFYSLNNTGYRLYSSPLYISHNSTIKAYAFNGHEISGTVTYTYELVPYLFASHNSGVYDEVQRVNLIHASNSAKIYYTLDGSTPNENSTPYPEAGGILISKSCTLKAVLIKAGCTVNALTRDFIIRNPIPDSELQYADGGLISNSSAETAAPASVSKLSDYAAKWGYNQLNSTQKKAYEALYNAARTHTEDADISSLKIKKSEIDKIYWAFDYDNPQFFALANGYAYRYYPSTGIVATISLKYSRTAIQETNLKTAFESSANSAIEAAKALPTEYDKLKYIHDWIVNRTDYTLNGPVYKSEADGPIVYGQALCEGYSKSFMYLAQSLGFDCVCIVGTANGGPHMWNMVKVNGSWYHIDTTFDDPVMSDGSRTLTHDYFLKGTYDISRTHTIDTPFAVPSAPRSY